MAQRNLEKLQMIRQYEREMREILEQLDEEYREDENSGPIEILYSSGLRQCFHRDDRVMRRLGAKCIELREAHCPIYAPLQIE